ARNLIAVVFFFSSRRRHTRSKRDWSSDVCSSDLPKGTVTVVDVEKGESTVVDFSAFDSQRDALAEDGVVLKKDTAPSMDLEPERSEERRVGKECRSRWGRDE